MALTLFESLSNIFEVLNTCCTDAGGDLRLNMDKMSSLNEAAKPVCERLEITPFQALMMAVILQSAGSSGKTSLSSIGKMTGTGYLKLMSWVNDFHALRDRWLIRMNERGDIRIPVDVMSALMRNQAYERPQVEGLSTKKILRRLKTFMEMAKDGQINSEQALEEIEILVKKNPETSISKACVKYLSDVSRTERYIFFILVYLSALQTDPVLDMDDVSEFVSNDDEMETIRENYECDVMELQIHGVIERIMRDGLVARDIFHLKENVQRDIFGELKKVSHSINLNLLDFSNKPSKEMFYNDEEGRQVQRLEELLSEKRLHSVYEAMKAKGMRTSFTCLFHGSPGTGKTETVYQIAKRTGRKVMEADVAQIKNCYVGETEKNVRRLFDDYRAAVAEEKLSPILLFNEADAIFGVRMEGATSAVDKMENSVQNIILQEMENLEGILIATTNLTGNLDPAFERRFLYKIKFNKPGIGVRSKIWQSSFPDLGEDDARRLSSEFDFSGGQIENISRKAMVDYIIEGKSSDYEALRAYCHEENISNQRTRIGF